jgi:hypothetical protein
MIVQYNQKAANERLKFLLRRRRRNAILNIWDCQIKIWTFLPYILRVTWQVVMDLGHL